jgi:hypothetical protein
LFSVFVWVSLWSSRETSTPITQLDKSFSVEAPTESQSYEIPELSFCELVKNPEAYNGKVIRLKGIFTMTQHGPLFDGECFQPEGTLTWVKTTQEQRDEIKTLTLKAYQNKASWEDLDMQAIGKFEKNILPPPGADGIIMTSDSHENQADYRFELIKIEKTARSQRKYEFPEPPVLRQKTKESRKK